jgi:branched-chain amino acid transport system substrate-binding protein
MDAMAKGIEKALAGGGKLTGESIKAALESMDAIDTGGVVGTGKVKFTADSHRGSTGSGIYQVKAGKLVEIAANQVP